MSVENRKFGKNQRYFDKTDNENDVKKIKLKPKSQQNFDGEVIKVDLNEQKPFIKKKFIRKFNNTNKKRDEKKPEIPQKLLNKYSRGTKVQKTGIKTNFFKQKQERKEVYLEYATEQAARAELLLRESHGFIEADNGETTASYRQEEIVRNVDLQSAAKYFKLKLDFGPYEMRYTKNGRHLLLGGRRGHIACFDWITKRLSCEMNVMEEVADVSWLHVNTMFACAQKKWLYIYDRKGTELHCIKRMHRVNRLEFLPYHFLLSSASSVGYLTWLDISVGEIVGNYDTRLGDIKIMRQNPGNGVLCVGGSNGVVSMWSPKVRQPLAKMVCHPTPIAALSIDKIGKHMITSGMDKKVKVWDLRALDQPLISYKMRVPVNRMDISQRGVLALAQGNFLQIYKSLLIGQAEAEQPYLRHRCNGLIRNLSFCPYEDVLGVSTTDGFESLLVPGSGEPNFDAYEDNPFETKSQQREHEVHALLEKIPAELITLDSSEIANVDAPTLKEKIDAKNSVFFLKPPKIDFTPRHKTKGRGGTANASRNKQIVKDQKRKEFIQQARDNKKEIIKEYGEGFIPLESVNKNESTALQRFKTKKTFNK